MTTAAEGAHATGRHRPDATESLLARVSGIWAELTGADPKRLAADARSSYTPAGGAPGDTGSRSGGAKC